MKKAIKIMICFVLIVAVCVFGIGVCFYGFRPYMYRFMYFDYRIKANITVYVDSKEADFDLNSVKFFYEDYTPEIGKKNVNNNTLILKLLANEYGVYSVSFSADEYDFELSFNHFNWWDVNTLDATFYIDTVNKTVTYEYDYTGLKDATAVIYHDKDTGKSELSIPIQLTFGE